MWNIWSSFECPLVVVGKQANSHGLEDYKAPAARAGRCEKGPEECFQDSCPHEREPREMLETCSREHFGEISGRRPTNQTWTKLVNVPPKCVSNLQMRQAIFQPILIDLGGRRSDISHRVIPATLFEHLPRPVRRRGIWRAFFQQFGARSSPRECFCSAFVAHVSECRGKEGWCAFPRPHLWRQSAAATAATGSSNDIDDGLSTGSSIRLG